MIKDFSITETTVSWMQSDKLNKVEKHKIDDAKYFKNEKLIIVFYYDKNDMLPCMIGYNVDGTERFYFKSKDEFGVDSFANKSRMDIPVVGLMKEGDVYTDYYFEVDPKDGSLDRYGRAY
ncbi:MAG TPA: hypothetical protein VK071_12405 [Tissierellales bacterium]|nr:hypothetical protein [Tissierellales bacterium]